MQTLGRIEVASDQEKENNQNKKSQQPKNRRASQIQKSRNGTGKLQGKKKTSD